MKRAAQRDDVEERAGLAPQPIRAGAALDEGAARGVRRAMELDHFKWDAQLGDVTALASFPLLISRATWTQLASLAEALTRELLAAEAELAGRPSLHRRLALPRALRALFLRRGSAPLTPAAARVMRFDFHWTTRGWRISEVNSDVPGGYTEATNLPALLAAHYPRTSLTGDPTRRLVDAIARAAHGPRVALVGAAGHLEDHQVLAHLAHQLDRRGLAARRVAPHQLRWKDGVAFADDAPLGAIVRFYQAEWLARLPRPGDWSPLFVGGRTPVANPGAAVLGESKRLPLVWDELAAPMTTFRRLLPETRSPHDAPWRSDDGWLVKAAFGNTGETVSIRAAMGAAAWARRAWQVLWRPGDWIAQRRFTVVPIAHPDGPLHVCLGVYTVDGAAAGAYARFTRGPIIDHAAIDAALLIDEDA